MDTSQNKDLMRRIFVELARGDGRLFLDSLSDDVTWTMIGKNSWAGTYRGKPAVQDELLRPLFAQFADIYTNRAIRFIAEGEFVAVECRGQVNTVTGKPYDNTYCWICRIVDGKLVELTEYMDTQLVATALEPRRAS